MKKIDFREYTYILHEYQGEVEISNEDFIKLQNKEIDMNYIMDNYELVYFGDEEPYYEDYKFDSIEWEE